MIKERGLTEQVCVKCFEGITNPVCEKCYTKQIALWLIDSGKDPITTKYVLSQIRKRFSEETTDALCIYCNKENVSVCTYCFFFKVENILRRSNLSEHSIKNFLEIFNYNLYVMLNSET